MNTKIISISDDQNTITHESGVVTEFIDKKHCEYCIYLDINDDCFNIPCVPIDRKDEKNGIFKLKTT